MIYYDTLLQNKTDIVTNMTAILRQNATGFSKKCARIFITICDCFIKKCDSYYKMRQFSYKIRQFLQNATFITNCDSTNLLSAF